MICALDFDDQLPHLAAENQQGSAKDDSQTLLTAVDSWTVSELKKQLNHTKKLLSETRKLLFQVQDRPTLTKQHLVTAATQQRALQEFDNSEQLQLELTPQLQTTSHAG